MDNFNKFTYVDILKSCIPIGRDKVLLINRLSNGMKKCKQGQEELLVRVLSPPTKVSVGQCFQNNGGVAR